MNKKESESAEFNLIAEIKMGDEQAFETLFFEYYHPLCRFALKLTQSDDFARDTVQEVFFKIWKNRYNLNIEYSISAYLYRAVKNQALNLIDQEESRHRLSELLQSEGYFARDNGYYYASNSPSLDEITRRVNRIWNLIEEMPSQQKMVFELHKKHGLSYKEIAIILNIARKTVENHMGRALKYLRENFEEDQIIRRD